MQAIDALPATVVATILAILWTAAAYRFSKLELAGRESLLHGSLYGVPAIALLIAIYFLKEIEEQFPGLALFVVILTGLLIGAAAVYNIHAVRTRDRLSRGERVFMGGIAVLVMCYCVAVLFV